MGNRVVLDVGHRKDSPGAVNQRQGISEFEFNNALVDDLITHFKQTGYPVEVDLVKVLRNQYASLPHEINGINPLFVVSFHCNAYNKQARGTEVLYYYKSEKGKGSAELLLKELIKVFGIEFNRGIKPKGVEDRGGYFLKNVKAPAIIAEPFFIDNDSDLKIAVVKRKELIQAYAQAIVNICLWLTAKTI